MNDPHVVALTYRVEHSAHVDFTKAPPRTVDNGAFRVTLDAGQARVEMLEHFATEQKARDAVEPFLDAWALAADLKHPEDRFRFVYEQPEIIDRNPPAGGAAQFHILGAAMTAMIAAAHVSRPNWPEPPVDIKISDLVKALHPRWLEYQERPGAMLRRAESRRALSSRSISTCFARSGSCPAPEVEKLGACRSLRRRSVG